MTLPLLEKAQYEALSEFRYQLSRFLSFSETAAKAAGITPLQYLLLLHVRGFPNRDWASITELAERLQMQHHALVTLLSRCEQLHLLKRQRSQTDKRQVEIHLLSKGLAILETLAHLHRSELNSLQTTFKVNRITEFNEQAPASTPSRS